MPQRNNLLAVILCFQLYPAADIWICSLGPRLPIHVAMFLLHNVTSSHDWARGNVFAFGTPNPCLQHCEIQSSFLERAPRAFHRLFIVEA